jgi:hypothetical protein
VRWLLVRFWRSLYLHMRDGIVPVEEVLQGLDIAAVVGDIAAELGTNPSRVALARTLLAPLSPHRSWELAAWLSSTTTSGPSTSGSIPRSRPGWPR